jgi:predicted  nucleic acid-binding Zn-ribbon protein
VKIMESQQAAGTLLQLWERTVDLGPVGRALGLAEAAGADPDRLRSAPYGQTSARVLDLRESLIGPDLAATAGCPDCGSRVEFTMPLADLKGPFPRSQESSLNLGGYDVRWRPATPEDLLEAAAASDPEATLRRRCLRATTAAGESVDPVSLPDAVADAAGDAMSFADPLADVQVQLTCPDCGVAFDADLDLASFVWTEVEARAKRVICEVDVLARAYGWTEPDVLALSEARRASYLRMALEGVV